MAIGRIGTQTLACDGTVAYLVGVDRDDVFPFCHPTAPWTAPSLDDGVLSFEFASDADEVYALAVEVDAGRKALWEARAQCTALELFLDAYASPWVEVRGFGEADDAVELQLLHEVASGSLDIWTDDWLLVDREDDDRLALQALAAIDSALPHWASAVRLDLGGAGTGYTGAAIVLERGHSLQELAAHLTSAHSRG